MSEPIADECLTPSRPTLMEMGRRIHALMLPAADWFLAWIEDQRTGRVDEAGWPTRDGAGN